MSRTRRWQRVAVAIAATSLLATACGGDGDDDETAEAAADPAETESAGGEATDDGGGSSEGGDDAYCADAPDVLESITVGINNPNYATQLAVVIADERGYFADEGITDVEIIETDEYIAGLIGGSLDIAQGDTDVLYGSAEASQEDLRYLGTYRNGEYQILGVAPGIEDPQDLVGKPVTGGDLEGRNTALIPKYLDALGVDPESVEMVPMGGNSDARLQALIEGTVAGASLFPRHRVPLEEAGGSFMYEEFEINPQEGVMATGEFIDNQCSTVIAFWNATLKARADMWDFDQAEELLELMRSRGFDIPDYFAELYDVEVEQVSEDGGFDAGEMDDLVAEQVDLGNLPADLDWRSYVDLRPLHAAQEAQGLPLNPESIE